MTLRRTFVLLSAVLILPTLVHSQATATSKGGHLATAFLILSRVSNQLLDPALQRVVAYNIEAKYDAAKHTLDGIEVLTYRNLTGQPLDRFPSISISIPSSLSRRGCAKQSHGQP